MGRLRRWYAYFDLLYTVFYYAALRPRNDHWEPAKRGPSSLERLALVDDLMSLTSITLMPDGGLI